MIPQPINRKKRFHFEISRPQLIFSIGAGLFILTWVFILGIIVGRGIVSDTISKAFQDKIAKLQSEKNELMKQVGISDQTAAKGQDDFLRPKLDFYDKLAKKEETAPLPATPSPSMQIPIPATQAPAQTVPAVPAKNMTSPPVVEKPKSEKKEPPPESKVKKETKGSPADTGLYLLQIGAYREEAVAQSSMNRLIEKGYPAHLSLKDIPQKGGKFYRVQLGPFKSKSEAEKMQTKLSQDGFQAIMVPKKE
jgi:cell division protein FtsN